MLLRALFFLDFIQNINFDIFYQYDQYGAAGNLSDVEGEFDDEFQQDDVEAEAEF